MTAPETAPGQAACETWQARRLGVDRTGTWELLSPEQRGHWEAAAQAAIDVFLAGDSVSAESIREALAAQERPAPGLEAAFAGGMRVRTAQCTADAHDGEHFQVRTNGHWLCGHLLASLLIAQGIIADPAAKAAPGDLREQLHALAAKWDANAARNQRNGQSLLDQGDTYGDEGLAIAEALGACVVELRALLADYETDTEPQPAPELAAAMAESRTLRAGLDEATGHMLAHHDGAVQRRARVLRKRAGLPS